ncbi:hypothetical protein [Streptomyces sp. NPDC088350]|uniref:hypothetical protein n=1 Tax=Streptomyces sp. NPDC088350 TaxID=3365854 RepID=UPI003823B144
MRQPGREPGPWDLLSGLPGGTGAGVRLGALGPSRRLAGQERGHEFDDGAGGAPRGGDRLCADRRTGDVERQRQLQLVRPAPFPALPLLDSGVFTEERAKAIRAAIGG